MTTTASSFSTATWQWFSVAAQSLLFLASVQALWLVCKEAYEIRLYALKEYGRIIHEFDPYFNYRATEYLYEHGWKAFCQWFDYLVWYPLGRPVGTTIYPGLQVTAVWLKRWWLPEWSINDICCFVPAWFGVLATLAVAWLVYECCTGATQELDGSVLNNIPGVHRLYHWVIQPASKSFVEALHRWTGSYWGLKKQPSSTDPSDNDDTSPVGTLWSLLPLSTLQAFVSAVAAAAIMSVVPAHLLRSIGGGYDNESIAMTAMMTTFACWVKSLKQTSSALEATVWGVLTGIAYFYMVAAWGGYTFVLNLIGVHAAVLWLVFQRYSTTLHRAYTAFYLVGTTLAIAFIPVVGWTPLKSLEQLGPLGVFGGLQLMELTEFLLQRRRRQSKGTKGRRKSESSASVWKLRIQVFGAAAIAGAIVVACLAPTGYFGPISSRVRGLFVKHTKTGNPLVDSVAEHQAASSQAYYQYLHNASFLAPFGFVYVALFMFNDSSSFLLVFGMAAYYFSHRMVRLILLTAPIVSALGGIVIGQFIMWAVGSLLALDGESLGGSVSTEDVEEEDEKPSQPTKSRKGGGKKAAPKPPAARPSSPERKSPDLRPVIVRGIRLLISSYVITRAIPSAQSFYNFSHEMAQQISHPTIVQKARTRGGETVLIDDYREAYFWLRDNTPEDARIMAWWDYGYQITGIANRTTIADGNTWNHEHIALLGRTLTAPEKEGHRIARHLADYLLVWAGGGGDDVAKSPHLRRIANSVYRGLCREPTCREFGFYSQEEPTPDMAASLLYKLHSNGIVPGVEADRNRFKEVYSSKYGKVRIYKILSVSKESKEWVADPANRLCDAPGSWFCPGQYPPALKKVLDQKKDFKQLEDFNREAEDDSDYQRDYMENLLNKRSAERTDQEKERVSKFTKLSPEDIDLINEEWKNNELTSLVYDMIAEDRFEELRSVLLDTPALAHIRSEDGRGPMFWAHEKGRTKIINMLKKLGVSETRTDANGLSPLDLSSNK